MRSDRQDVLMDEATKKVCPFMAGLGKRNCLVNNCMAWRFQIDTNRPDAKYIGWCGLAGIPYDENVYATNKS